MSNTETDPKKCRDLSYGIRENQKLIRGVSQKIADFYTQKSNVENQLSELNEEIFDLQKQQAVLMASTVASRGASAAAAGISAEKIQVDIMAKEIKKSKLEAAKRDLLHRISKAESARYSYQYHLERLSAEANRLNCTI
ncbi:hypothetical protein [Maritalea myrionectae]|uniref:hypothetical protein n=1 Tax=Maritalea myrionectae TaxID=454601 RepID=UPI00048951D0|nr:hypothetical protein [Maritalea myrionectae]